MLLVLFLLLLNIVKEEDNVVGIRLQPSTVSERYLVLQKPNNW